MLEIYKFLSFKVIRSSSFKKNIAAEKPPFLVSFILFFWSKNVEIGGQNFANKEHKSLSIIDTN